MLPVEPYSCEKNGLSVLKKKILRRVFGYYWNDVMMEYYECKMLYNEEFCCLYRSRKYEYIQGNSV